MADTGRDGTNYANRGLPANSAEAAAPRTLFTNGRSLLPEAATLLDPVRIFWTIFGYRWLILAASVAAILFATAYSATQTPMYRGVAKLELGSTQTRALQQYEVLGETRVSQQNASETAMARIRTRGVAQRVVYEMNLTERPGFYSAPPSYSILNLIRRSLGLSRGPSARQLSAQEREEAAIRQVLGGLNVAVSRRSPIATITFLHFDPEFAASVVNQVARSYIDISVDRRALASIKVRDQVQAQANLVKEQLTLAERQLNAYAREIDFSNFEDQPQIFAAQLTSVSGALNEAVQDRLTLELIVNEITQGRAASLPDVLESSTVEAIKLQIGTLQRDYQDKLNVYKPDFPDMVRLQSQIEDLQQALDVEITAIADSFVLRLAQSLQREASLRDELDKITADQRVFREKSVDYTILKREVDSKRAQFDTLSNRLNQIGVGAELQRESDTILEYSRVPRGAFSPQLMRIMALFLAVALIACAILIYIMELMNNSFAAPDEVETELGLPLLGVIPHVDAPDDLVLEEELDPALEEAYRSLRTSVEFAMLNSKLSTLSVTSTEPSEGKSITVYKLAEGFARLGKRVLLVDADMRRPKIHKWFGVANTLGLSTLLRGDVGAEDLSDLLVPTPAEKLEFLPAGAVPTNPTDLLASHEMAKFLHNASRTFDLVIIDCPPVMGLADAPSVARLTSATLFVVASRQASRAAAQNATRRLLATNANVIGSVMTKFKLKRFDYNYAYSYMRSGYYTYAKEQDA